ncbi:NADPH:quinone oxidoreductase family protein [Camelimonas abortus]|uniref:NADPH:quinone oxidoreductase family protein n=1 Tax=Camelimonas abortus TaxID=1017184 RepID=A0ABV7LDR0_9HYPH
MPRSVVCRELRGIDGLALEETPRQPVGPGQVRVEIHAACLNFPDLLMTSGGYQFRPQTPYVAGMEAAGVVAETGEGVTRVRVGDRVMVGGKTGAFAEEAVVAESQLAPLPETLTFEEGACFRVAYQTAWYALNERAHLKAGETLLAHGAGGGVGLAAVQIGKMMGATVIGCASSPEKLEVIRASGADHAILYGDGPFRDEVKRLTGGKGVDVVFDPVGGEVFEQSLRCMNWGCRLLVIGFTGGVGMAATNLVLIKGASVLGVRAGESARHDPESGRRVQKALAELAASGRLKPHISHVVPLERFREAFELMRDRKAIGRVVIRMR